MPDYLPSGLGQEPWVALPGGAELAGWGKEDEVRRNQVIRQTEKHRFFMLAFDYLKENAVGGDYLEFGCHRARTFRMALTEARLRNIDHMRFVAFDSFEGLPTTTVDPQHAGWTPGALATAEEAFRALVNDHGLFLDRIETVKGFFDQTLTPERAAAFRAAGRSAALATVDCDLYESSDSVFHFLEHVLDDGSVVYLDDLRAGSRGSPRCGMSRAFREWQARSRFRFEPHLTVGWWGQSYIAYL